MQDYQPDAQTPMVPRRSIGARALLALMGVVAVAALAASIDFAYDYGSPPEPRVAAPVMPESPPAQQLAGAGAEAPVEPALFETYESDGGVTTRGTELVDDRY